MSSSGRLLAACVLAVSAVSCSDDASTPYTEFLVAVGEQTFVLRVNDAQTAQLALENFKGGNSVFPIGPLRQGDGGFNAPWSWHFDPDAVRMAEAAIEVCDGEPSYVQANLADYLQFGYCPWSARVVAVRP
jgi:hypothetical protein